MLTNEVIFNLSPYTYLVCSVNHVDARDANSNQIINYDACTGSAYQTLLLQREGPGDEARCSLAVLTRNVNGIQPEMVVVQLNCIL